jgi:hypothetical protein
VIARQRKRYSKSNNIDKHRYRNSKTSRKPKGMGKLLVSKRIYVIAKPYKRRITYNFKLA